MDKRQNKNAIEEQEKYIQQVESVLLQIQQHPNMYMSPRCRFIRQFVSFVGRHPHDFHSVDGDDNITMQVHESDWSPLTKGYIKALSNLKSGSEITDNPILAVYVVDTKFRGDMSGRPRTDSQSLLMTEMRLVDGDGYQIHARLSVNLAQWGRMLYRGDKIRLDSFSELRYRVNEDSAQMPALFIHGISRVGYSPLPDEFMKELLPCSPAPSEDNASMPVPACADGLDPRKDPPPECTDKNRLCALYGIRFFTCVCKAIPVEERVLATIKEDCYFANEELDEMSQSHKRNMLFWWYATNVYSIVGKDNVKELPPCLTYAIRNAYLPEDPNEHFHGFHRRNSR